MRADELELDEGTAAVPVGRHFARQSLHGAVPADVVDAAELVVTELLTNAVLHGRAPVQLAVSAEEGSARVEVRDRSEALPVRPRAGADGMTGRGLALVDALAEDWGVTPCSGGGKAVWARLTPQSVAAEEPGEVDLDALLAAFDEREPDGRLTVLLGEAPTRLLLDANAHVDSVVRELVLAAGGASSGVSAAVPPGLASLMSDVVGDFGEARQAVKRQGLAADAVGAARTTLTLTLPLDAADAGERYLAAVEEADAWARASRLLTLAAPPQQAAFRRWYVSELVAGLRRAAAGNGEAVAERTFEQHLLGEVEVLAELQAVSDRAARLQRGTAALSRALEPQDVTQILLDDALAELGAQRGVVLLVTGDEVTISAVSGYDPDVQDRLMQAWAHGARTPGHVAYDTGVPVWVESREERDARFPEYAQLAPDSIATCATPLVVRGRVVGILRLSFTEPRLFNADERAFLSSLAAVAGAALERAELVRGSLLLSDQLARLQAVTTALTSASGEAAVLDTALQHATGLVGAERASISLLEPDGHTVRLARIEPALPTGSAWHTYDLADEVPASEAMRSGEALLVPDLATRDARWPAIADTARDFEHALAIVPMREQGTVLGALTFSFSSVRSGDDGPSLPFLTAFADVCGQALLRARAAEAAAESSRRLAFLAAASQELSSSLDVEATLARLARLSVPQVADWCVIHLLQDDELVCAAVEHVDPQLRALARDAQQRWPETLDNDGVGLVVRTGEPLLVPSVAEARAALAEAGLADDPEREALLDRVGLHSVVIAPLQARGRVLGAITLISAESRRTYGQEDVDFAQDLARRAAVAVDNSRLYALAVGEPAARAAPAEVVERPLAARLPGGAEDVALQAAVERERRAARALAGLGEVALDLAAADDVRALVEVVVGRGMAVLGADGGAVCVRDDSRGVVRMHASASLPDVVHEEYAELPLDGPLPGSYTARTGLTVLLPTVASGLAFTPVMQVVYDGTGRGAWASLPLRSGGRLLGSLVVSWRQEREFSAPDRELLAAFAAQCAQALDRVQALQAEREAASSARRLSETLQRSLLTQPPEPDHLQVAVRYVPASQEAQVGGDWYDAFFTPDDALCVVIGDCAGHDREAVAAMAAVRNLLRATTYATDLPPAGSFTALERTMAGLDVGALATALMVRIEQTDEQRTRGVRALRWSNAGHLPPVLRSADGTSTVLATTPDLMLGLQPDTPREDHVLELAAGATLVLFTDGLVERRGEDIDEGVERLRAVVQELGGLPLEELADGLLERLGGGEDDVALLAVRFHDERVPR